MNSIHDDAVGKGIPAEDAMNFEGDPLVEMTIDDTDYRIDAGKQGMALSVSMRRSGSWQWAFASEAKWDGSSLRARSLERSVREELALAFKQAVSDSQA